MKRLALLLPLLALAAGVAARGATPDLPPSRACRERSEDSPVHAQLRALRWLKSLQREDGSWPEPSAFTTSLALLAYAGSYDHGFFGMDESSHESWRAGRRFLVSDVGPDGSFRSDEADGRALPFGILAFAVSTIDDEEAFGALARAKRRLLDRQRESGFWGPENGPDDIWFSWIAIRALVETPGFSEDVSAAVQRTIDALAARFDAERGVLLSPDGSPDPATFVLPHVLHMAGTEYRSPAWDSLRRALAPVRFSWDGWDATNRPFASSSPLRDAAALQFSLHRTVLAGTGDWYLSFLTNQAPRQIVLGTNECDFVDDLGRKCELGWWDSPSEGEAGFCTGGPLLPCERRRSGKRIAGETTLAARIRDTCLIVAPNIVQMHSYAPERLALDIDLPPAFAPRSGAKAVRPTTNGVVRLRAPATNASAAPALHAESADGAKEPAP